MNTSNVAVSVILAILSLNSHAASWGYEGNVGPTHWGQVDPEYISCSTGKQQSPVNIETHHAKSSKLPGLSFQYTPQAAEITNNGHTIQINVARGSLLRFDDEDFELRQFHFHTPSEEEIDGKSFPMDAHFVHNSDDGQIVVVAVLFKEGRKNQNLEAVFNTLPDVGKITEVVAFNPASVLPPHSSYYKYQGSLTTPPCSSGVTWLVMKTPVELSHDQIAAFQRLYPMNARPVQPLNSRVIESSD
ncbi:carbonic anhydrase family protein [Pseudomonas gingeri]|uniref:carbonic anhydrase n=1 Tax=Pseudomonas gingeri TaxID=117681 RepID=UPI0015A0F897|nr:carbonic anhydrase family protein [Pseudomonas gingeri]NWA23716.1 carbonic anhydrase family protein [Pseudomonas gingeri]NWD68180.1 carbonic anhydrase family protein [Pseudomonas gingeri]